MVSVQTEIWKQFFVSEICLFDIIGPIIPQIFPRLGRLDETTWLYLRPCFLKRNLVYMFCTFVNTVFSVSRSIPANTDSDAHVCRPYQCSITCVCELRRWLGVICVISEGHKQTSITHWWRREAQNSCWWCFADKTVTFDLSVLYNRLSAFTGSHCASITMTCVMSDVLACLSWC